MTAPDDVTPETIATLLALEAEATPGPWEYDQSEDQIWGPENEEVCSGFCSANADMVAEGEFIAATRNALVPLCRALTKAWAERDEGWSQAQRIMGGLRDAWDEVNRLREALDWYADKAHWTESVDTTCPWSYTHGPSPAERDAGRRARKALTEGEKGGGA